MAWLLSPDDATPTFRRLNCLTGGTRFHRHDPTSADRFLAAISAYTCGVKIRDDVMDDGSLRARWMERFYRTTFGRAERDLEMLGFDVARLKAVLHEQQSVEERWERRLDIASVPTGTAYGMVARHLSELSRVIAPADCERIGETIGRLVFLADAYRDVGADAGRTYNPLTDPGQDAPFALSRQARQELAEYVVSCLQPVEPIIAQAGAVIADRWMSIRSQLLALFGLGTSSVILNSQCCIPCGDCFVVVDSDECGQCCVGLCCLICCAAAVCSK